MKYELILNSKAVSQNKLYAYNRVSWAYTNWRRKYQALLAETGCEFEYAECKRKVTITRLYGKREYKFDYGNLVGGFKPLIDALVSYGHLYDDSDTWSEQVYKQERAKDGIPRIRIELEDLDDAC